MIPVASQCAESVVTTIKGLGLSNLAQDEVALRDIQESDFAPRGISVVPMSELEGAGTNAKDDYGYRFMIVMSKGSGKSWTENTQTLTEWRNAVRKAFNNRRLAEVDKVHICSVANGDYLQPKKWQENKLASILVVTCWSRETRS